MRFAEVPRHILAARLVGAAFIGMYCAGLLLRTPWLAQTICWVALLPAAIWLILERPLPVRDAQLRMPYWLIVGGLAGYIIVLLIATFAAGVEWQLLPKQTFGAALCLITVAAVGDASRYEYGFACLFGRWLVISAGVAALVLLGSSFLQGTLGQDRLIGLSTINWVLNSNAVAAVYATSFAVAAGHALRQDISQRERIATAVVGALLFSVVWLTGSRGALLGCIVAIIIILFASPKRISIIFAGLLIAAVAICALAFPGWVSALLARGDSHRLALWFHFLQVSKHNFWLGYGLNFDPRFELNSEVIYTPHNIFLSALVRGGGIALVFLAVLLTGAIWAVVMAARMGWWLPMTVFLAAITLSTVDHEMIPGTFSYYWYVFWLPLSLAAAAGATPVSASKQGNRGS
jgi:hypothetical protein